ncbi:MAG TPA: GNAT family N-acetyltransferase [Devosiaceae bacterium]|jgi:RimJ/RimL family protein N-acetyltransferase
MIARDTLETARLHLRLSSGADARQAFEIRSDWQVSRMLSQASFPPVLEDVGTWFNKHEDEWRAGSAFRFAIDHQDAMIGLADLESVTKTEAVLGYWLTRSAWPARGPCR